MRVWHIHPGYLDDRRLMASNTELHMLRSCVVNGSNGWLGIVRPLAKSLHYVKIKHDQCAEEIVLRGGLRGKEVKHVSSFSIAELPADMYSVDFVPSDEDMIKDITQLRNKWERERYYHGLGRLDLCVLEYQYALPLGTKLYECQKIAEDTRKLVKDNGWWFKEFRLRNPKSRMQDRVDAFLKERDNIRGNSPR